MSALMLSCLGGIDCITTVKTLLARGCIIDFKDDQGRTAHDIALETNVNLAEIIDHEVQLLLMKQTVHIERKYTFAKLWILLHDGRASIPALFVGLTRPYTKKHCSDLASSFLAMNAKHTSHLALVQTMMLPFDLVTTIASFLPLPQLWEKRVEMLSRSYHLSPDITISSAIDLIDDVLDEMGFTDACDSIGITAPASFGTWNQWKLFREQNGMPEISGKVQSRNNSVRHKDSEINRNRESLRMRRDACFLQILSNRSPLLSKCLSQKPYNIPTSILYKLTCVSHLASLIKRMGSRSVHFDKSVASDIVKLAGKLVLWVRLQE